MDLKQIKDLISSMEKSGIKKLSLKEKTGFELHLEMQEMGGHPPALTSHHPHHVIAAHPIITHKEVAPVATEKVEGQLITSPMVGTFYTAPSPEDPPFIKVGDVVEASTVVCIIEAMKVMNEVKAGVKGTVAEIFLDSGHPVEFGTKLFRVV